jgi:serine/threonine-protein kinase
MPFVEGETLRARLDREHQLPIDEALRLAREVAGALDYAHRHAVIHRDIKPENVLLHEGQALVADFGIALALEQAGGGRMTQTGMSLGTPQYMAPEQATADRTVDARADVYALGAMTYEMLVGEPPFTGTTVQAVIAKVLTEEPPRIASRRRTVPPHVEDAVLHALEKLPADRFASAALFADALESPSGARSSRVMAARTPNVRREPGRRTAIVLGLALVVASAAAAAAWLRPRTLARADPQPRRLTITLPDSTPLTLSADAIRGQTLPQVAFALSHDGTRLVYAGRSGLYLRAIGDFGATALAGTAGATGPFFSPDGRWVGYFAADGILRKVSLETSEIVALAPSILPFGAAWGPDDQIYVSDRGGTALVAVPASGGATRVVATSTTPDRAAPVMLPGGRYLLHESRQRLAVTDVRSGRELILTTAGPVAADSAAANAGQAGIVPRYLATGHIAFVGSQGSLFVVPFDVDRLRLTGPPVLAVSGIRRERTSWAQYAVADDGTLAYVDGRDGEDGMLVWASGPGGVDSLPLPIANYQMADVSPDGRRLAVKVVSSSGQNELWSVDLVRHVRDRVLVTAEAINGLLWAPDSRGLLFDLQRRVLVRLNVDRPGVLDTLSRADFAPSSFSPDGSTIAGGGQAGPESPRKVLLFSPGSNQKPTQFTRSPAATREYYPAFSPDGRWLAYDSDEGGRLETYAEPYPGGGERVKVSIDGGAEPRWSVKGDKLFYRDGARFMVVPVASRSAQPFGTPRVLLEGAFADFQGKSFALAPDNRLLLKQSAAAGTTTEIRVITDWSTEVRRLTGAKPR